MLDVQKLRAETPGCSHVAHFNNAGAALQPQPVLDAVKAHLELEARIGGYEAAEEARNTISATRKSVARLLGCKPSEVAIVEHATAAWNAAFYAMPFSEGDCILCSQAAYASNYIACLQVSNRTGARVEVIPSDEYGQIDVEALRDAIDDRVALITLTHVPTNGGLVNPAEEVGAVAREARIPLLLDACQSAGQLPLDVETIGCDMLSATSRKYLRGPRGQGFLYVRESLLERLEPVTLDLHSARWTSKNTYKMRPDARRFETWESNVAAKIGLGVAVDYAKEIGLEVIWERIQQLGEILRNRLAQVQGATVHDLGMVRGGIVTFSLDDYEARDIKQFLRERTINVSVSSPSSTLLDAEARELPDLVRASVHYYNTEEEIDALVSALHQLQA